MIFDSLLNALRTQRPKLEPLDFEKLPSSNSSFSNLLNSSITSRTSKSSRSASLLTIKRHKLHDPRTSLPEISDSASCNGPQLSGTIVSFDLSAPTTPVKKNCSPPLNTSPAKEKDQKTFYVHAELVRPASIVLARHLDRGRIVVPVPGQDRDAIQLFVRFLYSGKINSNVADACSINGGCGTLNFKLHDESFTQLMTPDDEEKLLVKAYLFGYAFSCWTFCDAIIDTLICKILGQKRTPVLHNLVDLSTNCGSYYPLKILIAHLAIYTWSDNQLCGFALAHKFDRIDHVRFWADVGDYNAMHKTATYGLPKAPWRKSPCHYHVHTSYPKMNYTCYAPARQS